MNLKEKKYIYFTEILLISFLPLPLITTHFQPNQLTQQILVFMHSTGVHYNYTYDLLFSSTTAL